MPGYLWVHQVPPTSPALPARRRWCPGSCLVQVIGAADAGDAGADDQNVEMLDLPCSGNGAGGCGDVHLFRFLRTAARGRICVTLNPATDKARTAPRLRQTYNDRTPLPRGLQDPVAVKRQRRHAGQPATARGAVRSGRPADDADDDRAARLVLEYRRAGIPGAGAEPVARALPDRIDQADLQRARLTGRDQAGDANGAAALAVTAHGDADAGDGEAAAGHDRNPGHADHRSLLAPGRGIESKQRDIGGSAVRRHRLHPESRVDRDVPDVAQLRLPVRAIFDDLVGRPRLHAMRRRQHQLGSDQRAGAKITARADDGDDGARDALGRRRAAADDGMRGRGREQQRHGGNDGVKGFHQCSRRRWRSNPRKPGTAPNRATRRAGPRPDAVLANLQMAFASAGNDD